MRENKLYDRVRPHLTSHGAVSRVENSAESGMPDIHYFISPTFGWLETKVEHSGKLFFEKYQRPWATKYIKAGATKLFVLAALYGRGGVMGLYKYSEILKAPVTIDREFNVIQVADITPIYTMTKRYDWDLFRWHLVNS